MKVNKLISWLLLLFLVLGGVLFFTVKEVEGAADYANNKKQVEKNEMKKPAVQTNQLRSRKDPDFWQKSSEEKPYPTLEKEDRVVVSKKRQRVYIMRGDQLLYKMRCSTGSGGTQATPSGTYQIQAERGSTFYNQNSGEGANYWVSWKDHGTYLFHSVPIDEAGQYLTKDANELGEAANSHGCIRLSVADAKWFSQQAVTGMTVEIN